MNIQARIDRMVQVGNVKAIASVSLDGMFVVKGLKVMDGRKGLFVSMPQETFSGKDGQKQYSNLFFPLTNSAKTELQEAVLDAYRLGLDPKHQPRHNPKQQYNPERQYPEPGYREPGFREPGYRDFHEDHEGLPFMGMY